MDRRKPVFQNTEMLDEYVVSGIRLVTVPHMSEMQRSQGNPITNVRTNVGLSEELYI